MLREDSVDTVISSTANGSTGDASGTPESGSTPLHIMEEEHQDEDMNMEQKPDLNSLEHCILPQLVNEENQKRARLQTEVDELKKNFVVISHQMDLIMKALQVNSCPCAICTKKTEPGETGAQNEDPTTAAVMCILNRSGNSEQKAPTSQANHLIPMSQTQMNNMAASIAQLAGLNYSQANGGGKFPLQTSSTDRRNVAEYAKAHGAIAAARKFGVPPPVSSYYQKKEHQTVPGHLSNPSPEPSSEGEMESAEGNGTQPSTPLFNNPIAPSMADLLRMNNPAHSSGSPGFLRGRGRGRPKLIGDELDADLVEYMVQVKNTDPDRNLTATQALQLAKEYIMERAPGLLEEHGGHVKLKVTWAMKLVTRIAERQKEIELGLPAGALSNMGRTVQQLGNMSTNMVADMMAQNIINQQMFRDLAAAQQNQGVQQGGSQQQKMHQGGLSSSEHKDPGFSESSPAVSATPEILNVRELQLKFDDDGMLNLDCLKAEGGEAAGNGDA